MSSRVGVIVSITVKAGRGSDQIALFDELAPLVRAEEGCLAYDLHAVVGDRDRFKILEWWASAEALADHGKTSRMVEAAARASSFRAGPAEITLIEPAL